MDTKKIKGEANEKFNNEKEAIVRDYYLNLIERKEILTSEYNERMKDIEEQEVLLNTGKFKVGCKEDVDGMCIIFDK